MQKTLGALFADLATQIKAIASADESDLAQLQEPNVQLGTQLGSALGI